MLAMRSIYGARTRCTFWMDAEPSPTRRRKSLLMATPTSNGTPSAIGGQIRKRGVSVVVMLT